MCLSPFNSITHNVKLECFIVPVLHRDKRRTHLRGLFQRGGGSSAGGRKQNQRGEAQTAEEERDLLDTRVGTG
ncbi:hypothetical protein GN956_G15597 [Arapaima gigas]